MCCAFASTATSSVALAPLAARARIAAIADPGSVADVDAGSSAPRPSPHLARWGIVARDDDGVVLARASLHGAPVLIAAQDERFLGGSAGVRHADALRGLFERAGAERPAAVILLGASAGVRLHEANPAELAVARALAALADLRVAGVRVLAVGVRDLFGGAAVLACAADRTALLPGTRLGLTGPRVIEMTHGKSELDADDTAAVAALCGAESRARAGEVDLVADDAGSLRAWIASCIADTAPFAARIEAMQARLEARLVAREAMPPAVAADRIAEAARTPTVPLPRSLSPFYAGVEPVDRHGWLWRLPEHPIWLTRPFGLGTFGPREAHALDAALLAHLTAVPPAQAATLFLVGDSLGHDATAAAEALCVAQYLAHHTAVLALLRARGIRLVGLLTGVGHGAAFFVNALQAPRVYALAASRVVAMEPGAIAHVLRKPPEEIEALVEDDPVLGHPLRHFASWGGIAEILPALDRERLLALAAEH